MLFKSSIALIPLALAGSAVAQSDSFGKLCASGKSYTVVAGDTCSAIATAMGTTLEILQSTNSFINCADLWIGTEVCFPSATGAAVGTTSSAAVAATGTASVTTPASNATSVSDAVSSSVSKVSSALANSTASVISINSTASGNATATSTHTSTVTGTANITSTLTTITTTSSAKSTSATSTTTATTTSSANKLNTVGLAVFVVVCGALVLNF